MNRTTTATLLAALTLVATPSLARAQDGVSQRIDPSSPRGGAQDGTDAGAGPAAAIGAAVGGAVEAVGRALHLPGFGDEEPAPTASATPAASSTPAAKAPAPSAAPASPPVGPNVHFARSSHPDCSGAFFRKVKSARSSSYRGVETIVTLPRVNGFDPEAKPLVAPSVYLGGNGGQELDIGLSWDKVRDANGDVVTDASGKAVHAFRPFARYSGMSWWTNSPNAPAHKGDWASNSRQYFYPGEQVRMSVKVLARNTIQLTIQSTADPSKKLDRTFDDVPGFAPGHATEWKRVHSIDESGRENKSVVPTGTSLTDGHWDEVRMLLADGTSAPMTGSHFTDVPGGDFHRNGTIDAALYNGVFKPASGWGWTQDGGEAIQVEPYRYFGG